MDAFRHFTAPLAVLRNENVDTDQIIPARFLTTTQRAGLGQACFADWRYDADGGERSDFPLRMGPGVLLAGRNFGCGSSREHAPWALLDFGIRVVIATRIADIFRNNALKNGLLPIVVSEADWTRIAAFEGLPIHVDLEGRRVALPDGTAVQFEVEAFARECLLRGVDQLGYLLGEADAITRHERQAAA